MKNRQPIGLTVFCADTYCPLLSLSEVSCPSLVTNLKQRILALGVQHASLLDYFSNLNRDYMGRFFDSEAGFLNLQTGKFQEVYVDMDPLEEAPIEWWRDNFSPAVAEKPVIRLRCEARPRWQALGSIYFAWHPWERSEWRHQAANDNRAPGAS
ncbi:MAG: hypothetical protein RLP08_03450 [Marinovum algicola]|jgi:hypothetical protein|uniref:hypothetical protein n=1 Tax=Roseobacteraceae TaxID=2854170 RepID=UPI0007C2D22F|nr:hypothetical protein [Sulfitobacter sp. HI0054]KZY52579.1 hypothetical protein A3734_18525 [Sulfitobacter sp. HI0054]